MSEKQRILVLGASGYVGGRLTPRLLEMGYTVRAGARSVRKLACRPFAAHPNLELAEVDVLDPESLAVAVQDCRAVYYLVHSMSPTKHHNAADFSSMDMQAAQNMARAAQDAGVERIIYLGGLGDEEEGLSKHLRSRRETGDALRSGKTPVTELRAAMILGAGSASFEMMRYLVERLPVMVTPRWVGTRSQPIAVSNVLGYLLGCLENDAALGRTFDIGGPDVLNYRELFDMYTEEAGLPKRVIIPVPVLTPRLSSYWIHLVTPVPASLAKPLAEGLRNEVVCRESSIQEIAPQKLLSCREAIRSALQSVEQHKVDTCWSDAGAMAPPEWLACGDAPYAGGTVLECNYRAVVDLPPPPLWERIAELGGDTGWYFGDALWGIRGWIDRLLGGSGLRRGRRDKTDIRVGDALDFWRVLDVEHAKRLMLLAEMKLPGEAIFQLHLTPQEEGRTQVSLIMRFLPRGLFGILYWYAFYPFHILLGRGMLRNLARAAGGNIVQGPAPFSGSGHLCMLPAQGKKNGLSEK